MKKIFVFLSILGASSCLDTELHVEARSDVTIGTKEESTTEFYQTCKNGEVLVVVPQLPSMVDSVQFYWDSRYVETKSSMPFVAEYELNSEPLGMHAMKCLIYYKTDESDLEIKSIVKTYNVIIE